MSREGVAEHLAPLEAQPLGRALHHSGQLLDGQRAEVARREHIARRQARKERARTESGHLACVHQEVRDLTRRLRVFDIDRRLRIVDRYLRNFGFRTERLADPPQRIDHRRRREPRPNLRQAALGQLHLDHIARRIEPHLARFAIGLPELDFPQHLEVGRRTIQRLARLHRRNHGIGRVERFARRGLHSGQRGQVHLIECEWLNAAHPHRYEIGRVDEPARHAFESPRIVPRQRGIARMLRGHEYIVLVKAYLVNRRVPHDTAQLRLRVGHRPVVLEVKVQSLGALGVRQVAADHVTPRIEVDNGGFRARGELDCPADVAIGWLRQNRDAARDLDRLHGRCALKLGVVDCGGNRCIEPVEPRLREPEEGAGLVVDHAEIVAGRGPRDRMKIHQLQVEAVRSPHQQLVAAVGLRRRFDIVGCKAQTRDRPGLAHARNQRVEPLLPNRGVIGIAAFCNGWRCQKHQHEAHAQSFEHHRHLLPPLLAGADVRGMNAAATMR